MKASEHIIKENQNLLEFNTRKNMHHLRDNKWNKINQKNLSTRKKLPNKKEI